MAVSWSKFIDEEYLRVPLLRTRDIRQAGNSRFLSSRTGNYLNFISNDYLGLATHAAIKSAMTSTCNEYGTGSTGAASLSGYTLPQQQLAVNLSAWLKQEATLLVNSGYTLNWGLYKSFVSRQVIVWLDENCHASHIDGVLFSRIKFRRFNRYAIDDVHKEIISNQDMLHLIVSEGVFSMDGSSPYLPELIRLRRQFGDQVLLVIDDAHGLGCVGQNGWGQLELSGYTPDDVDLLIGTFGKAFGSYGAFISGKKHLIDYLQQTVRSQIYTTCLPPAVYAASNAALDIITHDEGQQLRHQLSANIMRFRQLAEKCQLPLLNAATNVSSVQLLSGDSLERLQKVFASLLASGIRVSLIQYPTVPKELPRLRISLSALHTTEDIHYLCSKLREVINAGN